MTLKIYTGNSGLFAVPSKGVIFVVITLFVLLMQSCGAKKVLKEYKQVLTDSVIEKTEITREPVIVPPAQVDLRLAIKDVMKLPPGAVFQKKDKQAAVKIEYRDSIVYITSTCDSLELLVESKNREIARLRSTASEKQIIEKTPVFQRLKNDLFFIVVGIILTYIIRIIKTTRVHERE